MTDLHPAIVQALSGRGHEILNLGMSEKGQEPELMCTDTGLLSALFLYLKTADFLEDEINAIHTVTYNSQEICNQLAEFVHAFPALTEGERKLKVDSLITEVVLKHKEVVVALTPPLSGLGLLSTELAPRGIELRSSREFIIRLGFNLDSSCSAISETVNIFILEHL